MAGYANRVRPPRTLTDAEVRRLLSLTGQRAADYMDHVVFALALGTGLRISEMSALDVADVYNDNGFARTRLELRVFKRCGASNTPQEVMVGDGLRAKLDRFGKWRQARDQPADGALFVVPRGRPRKQRGWVGTRIHWRRLSARRIGERFGHWRKAAQLSPSLTCHALRHTFLQALYDETRDLALVKRAARHANVTTTTIYAQASADDVLAAVQEIER